MKVHQSDRMLPGEHPHSDRPNWRPAETFEDYQRNCAEGLERWTEKRAAKLLGLSRVQLWRCRMIAKIPGDLFDRLNAQYPMVGTKTLAQIGLALQRGTNSVAEIECCPHCGGELRVRWLVPKRVRTIIDKWLDQQQH